jgi:hypothetical protein
VVIKTVRVRSVSQAANRRLISSRDNTTGRRLGTLAIGISNQILRCRNTLPNRKRQAQAA